MKKIIYVLIFVLIVPNLFGQKTKFGERPVFVKSIGMMNFPFLQAGKGEMDDRMEMMMTWKLTNDLNLTPEQADKFFPRFKVHRDNMGDLEKETFEVSEKIKDKIDKGKDISAKEFDEALENINQLEIQKIEERERFVKEMSDYLTINQLAKLALYRHYFLKDLRKEIRRKPRGGA